MLYIDELFCKILFLCKVVFVINKYYIEDVYCVGGMMVIIWELGKVGLVDLLVDYVVGYIMVEMVVKWDVIDLSNEVV